MKTLEKQIETILAGITTDPEATYKLVAHELLHDGESWSTNDVFAIVTDADLNQALEAVRGRWEVFKANYYARARVSDIECNDAYQDEEEGPTRALIECAGTPFLDIEITPS